MGPLADLLIRRRGAVLALVALLTAGFAFAASGLKFGTSAETILESGYEDLAGLRDHEAEFGSFEHRVLAVLPDLEPFTPAGRAKLGRAAGALAAEPRILAVRSLAAPGFPLPDPETEPERFRDAVLRNGLLTPFLVSRDGRTPAVHLEIDPAADEGNSREELLGWIDATLRGQGLAPLLAGVPAVRAAYASSIRADLYRLPPLVGGLLVLLLLVAFRRLWAALAPLGVVALAAVWSVGVVALTGGRITALTAILPSLIMVVGVATGVHVVAAFGEARARGLAPREAAALAAARMLLPCGLTAVTTAVGFCSLAVARIRDVREFGLYSAAGALLSFVLGIPLVAILLSYGRSDPRAPGQAVDRPLRRLAVAVGRRPGWAIAAGAALALVSIAGLPLLSQETFLLEDVRAGAPIQKATRFVDRELGGVIGFDLVVSHPDGLLTPARLRWLRSLEEETAALPGVRTVLGPGLLLTEAGRAAGVPDPLAAGPLLLAGLRARGGAAVAAALCSTDGRRARLVVRTGDVGSRRSEGIRNEVLALAGGDPPAGVALRAAGLTVLAEKLLARLVTEMARSTALAFVVIFLLMSVLFRSVRVGALSMIPNFLPLLVAGGFMGFAGITVRSAIALIFAVGLGIAVDDTIHLLMRYRRERAAGAVVRGAVRRALRFTGRPVLLTSVILFLGFLVFLTSGFKATEQFGLIAAVTIAAALVGDLLLLPGLLLLARRRIR